ncbi:MAG: hypothetical protein JO152_08975 [Mycobacteriaceae bacterium]|nr:hypothetical protein [Mycobacteriaceae bacterium]
MLIVALVMAVIGLAALVTAVVTSNEVIAWVCIGASVIGVVLLIIDALRERQRGDAETAVGHREDATEEFDAEYPEESASESASSGAEGSASEPASESASEGSPIPHESEHTEGSSGRGGE